MKRKSNICSQSIWTESNLVIHWDSAFKISEPFFSTMINQITRKILGALGGAIVFEVISFDHTNQTATIHVLTKSWSYMKMALFFAFYENHRCRIEILSERQIDKD